jgi:N-acyl-D-glutamate deacylase
MTMKNLRKLDIVRTLLSAGALMAALSVPAIAADIPTEVMLFKNVNVFDGKSDKLPKQPAVGVQSLLVNGELVVDQGELIVDAGPGRPIRRTVQAH